MKAKATELNTKVFEPLELTLTIESEAELAILWARFNLPWGTVWNFNSGSSDKDKKIKDIRHDSVCVDIWRLLNTHWNKQIGADNES